MNVLNLCASVEMIECKTALIHWIVETNYIDIEYKKCSRNIHAHSVKHVQSQLYQYGNDIKNVPLMMLWQTLNMYFVCSKLEFHQFLFPLIFNKYIILGFTYLFSDVLLHIIYHMHCIYLILNNLW